MDPDGYFDHAVAATYDEDSAERFDPAIFEPTVDFLAELAGSGSVLEFAIGTGRIAIPLAERQRLPSKTGRCSGQRAIHIEAQTSRLAGRHAPLDLAFRQMFVESGV